MRSSSTSSRPPEVFRQRRVEGFCAWMGRVGSRRSEREMVREALGEGEWDWVMVEVGCGLIVVLLLLIVDVFILFLLIIYYCIYVH